MRRWLKVCSECGEAKPATAEFFEPDKRVSSGLRAKCKRCRAAYFHRRWVDDPEKWQEYSRSQHGKHRDREIRRMAEWRSENEERVLEYSRTYRETHRDEISASARRRRRENPELFNERSREWCSRNPEKRSAQMRAWHEAHPEANATYARNRHARVLNAPGTHSPDDVAAQLERQKSRCYWCGEKVSTYHVDHVTPISKGGSNGPENIVIACPTCNLEKHAKHPMEWAGVML